MKEWMSEEIVETLQLVQNDAGIFLKDVVNFVCWWFAGMPVNELWQEQPFGCTSVLFNYIMATIHGFVIPRTSGT